MRYILMIFLSLTYLGASCKDYTLLGAEKQKIDKDLRDTIVWNKEGKSWSVSKPIQNFSLQSKECKKSGYILLNNNKKNYPSPLYTKKYYDIKKGWNYFTTPKDGVDVPRTFNSVEFVYVYDRRSKAWAAYSPNKDLMKKIKSTRILEVRYIEPNKGFYVLSQKAMRVPIISKVPNLQCQAIMKNKNYEVIFDSGSDAAFSFNKDMSIGLYSRNFSHTRKGIYNDSRIVIMVPKLKKLSKDVKPYKYGPAIPKMMIHFNKAYEDKEFYAYDFLNEECRKGYFPSKKRPPAPTLKLVK